MGPETVWLGSLEDVGHCGGRSLYLNTDGVQAEGFIFYGRIPKHDTSIGIFWSRTYDRGPIPLIPLD